jgi:hypothetical protein
LIRNLLLLGRFAELYSSGGIAGAMLHLTPHMGRSALPRIRPRNQGPFFRSQQRGHDKGDVISPDEVSLSGHSGSITTAHNTGTTAPGSDSAVRGRDWRTQQIDNC